MTTLGLVADHLVRGDVFQARATLLAINGDPLTAYWSKKEAATRGMKPEPTVGRRGQLSEVLHRAVLERDGWHCRYCGLRIIDRDARKRMTAMMGHDLIWGPKDSQRHAVLLVFSGVADHVKPAATVLDQAEADDMENLVASCWTCNFGKMEHSCEALGLEDPRERPPLRNEWDGLRRVLWITWNPEAVDPGSR